MDIAQYWSGGKDSTCAGILHLERGDRVHFICYIPMFDDIIPLIGKEHYDFLFYMSDIFVSMGAEVTFTNGGLTYWDYCTKVISKGPRKGLMQQYPCFIRGFCGFNRDSKTPACKKVLETLHYDFVDIGICSDEFDRKKIIKPEMSILQELGFTQKMTFNFCANRGFLSPSYLSKKRDGCLLCPHGNSYDRIKWFTDYQDLGAKDKLLELQNILRNDCIINNRKIFYPLRNYHFFIENSDYVSPLGTNIFLFGDTIN